MKFYLGTHREAWLAQMVIPLFISRRVLMRRKTCPRALTGWALDSGGFSELSLFGRWTVDVPQYAREVERWSQEIGNLEWAASMDYMCEPWILKKTGLSIQEHQQRTVNNYIELLNIAPHLPFTPVLQGWQVADYLRHVEMYARAGVDLFSLPRVGLGTVCRRQDTETFEVLVHQLQPIRLHGFGVKMRGIVRAGSLIESADSMAWSFAARHNQPLPGCTHKNCANCSRFALQWRARLLEGISTSSNRMLQGRMNFAELAA